MTKRTYIFAFVLAACAWVGKAPACDVPVFRYALEFWPAAAYEAVILHREALGPKHRAWVEQIKAAASQNNSLNLSVREANLDDAANTELTATWEREGKPALPALLLRYPADLHLEQTVWCGALDESSLKAVTSSPAREEIARRILAGQSAVFVFLNSGDAVKDESTRRLLEGRLATLEKTLHLPEAALEALKAQKAEDVEPNPPLQVRFSVLAIARNDPAETVFVSMLMHSEADLKEYATEPLVFPVYGRGRALYALVGKGIDDENVHEACKFLVGACSCQAKEDNPGTDLLMEAAWDSVVKGSLAQTIEQSPLVGLQTLAQSVRGNDVASSPTQPSRDEEIAPVSARGQNAPVAGMSILRNFSAAFILIIIGSAAFVFFALRQSARNER